MEQLAAAALCFLGIHLLVSGTTLRDVLTRNIGEKPYLGFFALTSLAVIVWLACSYNAASVSTANTVLFNLGGGFRSFAGLPVMLIAFMLVLPGVLRGNPTSQGQEKAKISGILRITRHPFLWGATLWSGFHLLALGTLAGVLFFGTFFLVAVIGMRAIDGKVKRKRPADWAMIISQSSAIPFAAIFEGKNIFVAREIFDWRFGIALVAFVAFAVLHVKIFSVPAFPPQWLGLLTL
ncbi:putative membrane protein [Rhizomicrobium palustre]|uniref:Putative membrane protein n=1 Tax=Rhizomicrobium palustre TaxID=189966 RepID=A0A846MXL6_9PROT|nr:NnrU family protein [Rhizomicrobium palustre]NIK88136.1 putative membrane protein [Rhizomicrobium palustre]